MTPGALAAMAEAADVEGPSVMSLHPLDFLSALSVLEQPAGVVAVPTSGGYRLVCRLGDQAARQRLDTVFPQGLGVVVGVTAEALAPQVPVMPPAQADGYYTLGASHWPGSLVLVIYTPHPTGLMVPDGNALPQLLALVPDGLLYWREPFVETAEPGGMTASAALQQWGGVFQGMLTADTEVSGAPATVVAVETSGRLVILRPGSIVLD